MTDNNSFRRVAAVAGMMSLPLAVGSLITLLLAVRFDLNAISDPLLLIQMGPTGAELWYWSMILDILGYYLLIVPLLLFLRAWLRPASPNWTDLFILCVLLYCVLGAAGAAILATVIPPLMKAYVSADVPQREILEVVFGSYSNAVYRGLWNLLEEFLVGVGWIGIGLLLRAERQQLSLFTIVLGSACLADSLGSALNIEIMATTGLIVYLFLAPIWAFWLGIDLLRTNPKGTRSPRLFQGPDGS